MVSGAFTLDDEIQIHRGVVPGCFACVTDSGERCWSASSISRPPALRGLPSSGGAYAGISFTPVLVMVMAASFPLLDKSRYLIYHLSLTWQETVYITEDSRILLAGKQRG